MTTPTISLVARLWLALTCWIRLLADGAFAARVQALQHGRSLPDGLAPEALSEPQPAGPKSKAPKASSRTPVAVPEPRPDPEALALQLLGAFQREGRLIDFLQQDVRSFSDADIGAAARVVHEGCRKALERHVEFEPVRSESEGASIELPAGFDASSLRLTGSITGSPPYHGTLRHKGWRATRVSLPEPTRGHDARVIFPAEVEL